MEQRWATMIVMNVPCIFLFQTSWVVTWTTRPPQSSRSTLEATTAPCSAQASVSASVWPVFPSHCRLTAVRRFQSTSSKRVKPPHNCPFPSGNLQVIQGDFRRHRSRHLRCWLVVTPVQITMAASVSANCRPWSSRTSFETWRCFSSWQKSVPSSPPTIRWVGSRAIIMDAGGWWGGGGGGGGGGQAVPYTK